MRRPSTKTSLLGLVFSIVVSLGTFAMAEVQMEADLPPELKSRYQTLIAELRCPKCLNINIADSNAPIAADLRVVVKEHLLAGKSDQEIRDFLEARYGEFILYDPPLRPATLALFLLPASLILAVALLLLRMRTRKAEIQISDSERETINRLRDRTKS